MGLSDENRRLTTRHGEVRESVYCAVAEEAHPSPTKNTSELQVGKQHSHNKTEADAGDESSNLRCNKKSLSLSIANGRLKGTQPTHESKGSVECQQDYDEMQYNQESLNFNKQSK